MTIDTNKLRSTYINGKKAYFVSDIAEHFGNKPVKKLIKNKAIFTERVKHNNNSQTRRLVLHKDLESFDAVPENRESVFTKFKKLTASFTGKKEQTQEFLNNYQPVQEGEKVEMPDISLEAIRDKQLDLGQARNEMIQKRINDLCYREARKTIRAKRLTEKESLKNDRQVYREPYLILYNTFDRYMRAELVKFNMTLEDVGLGYAKNTRNRTYIDRIAEAGQLDNLLVVAEALFQPKTNN